VAQGGTNVRLDMSKLSASSWLSSAESSVARMARSWLNPVFPVTRLDFGQSGADERFDDGFELEALVPGLSEQCEPFGVEAAAVPAVHLRQQAFLAAEVVPTRDQFTPAAAAIARTETLA
jgi:hypothetical protein